jgi:hypothetical protein
MELSTQRRRRLIVDGDVAARAPRDEDRPVRRAARGRELHFVGCFAMT